MAVKMALRAKVIRGAAEAEFVGLKHRAVPAAVAQLGQDRPMVTRKRLFGTADRRRIGAEKRIGTERIDGLTDCISMNRFPGVAVVVFLHNSVDEERGDCVGVFRGERILLQARTGVGSDRTMGDVRWTERRCEVLRAQHVRMRFYRHLLHLPMKVRDGG